MATKRTAKARVPRQARSRETVKAIVQASERVLAAHGKSGFTTTRVAEVAGVSAGTLYEYFKSKHALLRAVEERSWVDQVRLVATELDAVDGVPIEDAVYRVSYAALDAMLRRGKLHGFP